MILLLAISFVLFEAITEGLVKRHCPELSEIIFEWWMQWIIALSLFLIWFLIALNMYYVPIAKLVAGFVFVRFAVFDVVWNLTRGVAWNYYGDKVYDRIMKSLADFGWFLKLCASPVGVVFLMGWS